MTGVTTIDQKLTLKGGWSERSLPLATVLLTPWAVFQGASAEVVERAKEEGEEDVLVQSGNALEVSFSIVDDPMRARIEIAD